MARKLRGFERVIDAPALFAIAYGEIASSLYIALGIVTGWVLFLDFLIVMALSAVFVPHYLAGAFGTPSLRESPWDAIIGCLIIASIAGARLARRTRLHLGSVAVALLDLVVQGLLLVLGLAFLLSPSTLGHGFGFA